MITKEEALSFLMHKQPMPSDDKLDKNDLEEYEKVRQFFINHPDEQCIPLFLNSFGGKDGWGVYQMVEDAMILYDKDVILPYLLDALDRGTEFVKYWCIQIALNFPDNRLVIPLSNLLKSEDEDIKLASVTGLAQLALNNISVHGVIYTLENEMNKTSNQDIKEFLIEVLEDVESNA